MTEQLRGGLFELTGAVIAVALAILVVALVTGPYPWAVAFRRGVARLARGMLDAGGRMTNAGDARDVVSWAAERGPALQICGALLVVTLLMLFNISWAWFHALVVLLAAWELALWRLGSGSPPDASPIPE